MYVIDYKVAAYRYNVLCFQLSIVVYLDQYLCIMYNLDNLFTIHNLLIIFVYLTYYDVLHCVYNL